MRPKGKQEPSDHDRDKELEEAAAAYGDLGLRFDRARSLLALGRVQRRTKKWGAARSTLEEAAAELDDLGSPGWADEAQRMVDATLAGC